MMVCILQGMGHFQAGQHAQDAVKAPAGIHRVGVRTRGQGLQIIAPAGAAADQVAGSIQAHLQAGASKAWRSRARGRYSGLKARRVQGTSGRVKPDRSRGCATGARRRWAARQKAGWQGGRRGGSVVHMA
jgi:hypothetical protein